MGGNDMKYERIRKIVLDAIEQAVEEGLVHGTSGNIALRDDEDDVVAITPSGISYRGMKAEDIAIVDLNGKWLEGNYKPSSEVPMHTARSEEHTSELQSRQYLVCRLLLEKKKKKTHTHN